MQNHFKNYKEWQVILDVLEQGGMTDYKKYPEVYKAWSIATRTNNYDLLKKILSKNPWIYIKAKEKVKKCPFLPYPAGKELYEIQGQFNIGYINPRLEMAGLNPLDFTRGLYVCGETGSGKSYPILRICNQILSIPKSSKKQI